MTPMEMQQADKLVQKGKLKEEEVNKKQANNKQS